MSSAKVVPLVRNAAGITDRRILRGLMKHQERPDHEDCLRNWRTFEDHRLELDRESSMLVDYLRSWHLSFGYTAAPELGLVKEHFEKLDEIEVVELVSECANAVVHIRTNFTSLCDAARRAQGEKRLVLLLRDVARITEHGVALGKGKMLRGAEDAVRYLYEELASHGADVTRSVLRSRASVQAELRELGERPRLPTGLPSIDDATGGGLPSRHVHVAVAPPGHCKSTYLRSLAARALSCGWPVVYVCADEGDLEAEERMSPLLRDVDTGHLMYAEGATLDQAAEHAASSARSITRARAVASISSRQHSPWDLEDEYLIDHEVKSKRLAAVPVVIVDSLQSVGDGKLTEYERLAATMASCRRLAREHGALFLVASEANRSSYSARARSDRAAPLAAGKGNSSIEYKADSLLVLEDARDEGGVTVVGARVPKLRGSGKKPEFSLRFDGRSLTEGECAPAVDRDAEDLESVLSLISRHSPSTTRELYVHAAAAGITKRERVDRALAAAKARGLVTGGHGKPMATSAPPTLAEILEDA